MSTFIFLEVTLLRTLRTLNVLWQTCYRSPTYVAKLRLNNVVFISLKFDKIRVRRRNREHMLQVSLSLFVVRGRLLRDEKLLCT